MFLTSLFSAIKISSLNLVPPLRRKLRREKEEAQCSVSLHPVVRTALIGDASPGRRRDPWKNLDSRWLKIVGQVRSSDDIVALYEELRPDVVLLDMTIPKGDERACLRTIREMDPGARFVILTDSASTKSMGEAKLMRAAAIVPIDARDDQIEAAIRQALGLTV